MERSAYQQWDGGWFWLVGCQRWWWRVETSASSSHPSFDTSPRRAHWEFKHRLSDVPLPLVNCRNSFMLQVLLFYGHGPGEWLCRAPQLANFSTRTAVAGFVYVCVCALIEGVNVEREREEVSVWACPFLTSHSIHHFVVPAADETAVWCIPFWKVNMIRIPGLKWHSPHFLGTWATSSWDFSAWWTGTETGLWGWLSHSPNTSRPARSYQW